MPLLAVLGNGRKRVLAARARLNAGRPTPRGSAHPLKRLVGPIRWEDMSKAQKLQLQAQFLYGGMPYDPSGTYWSLMQYPKQVGGMRLWKRSQFTQSNGSCCKNSPRCGHNKGRTVRNPLTKAEYKNAEGYRDSLLRAAFESDKVGNHLTAQKLRARAEGINDCLFRYGTRRVEKNSVLPMVAGGIAAGVAGAVTNRFLRNGKLLSGIAPDGTKYVVKKDREWNEWQVVAYVGGKRHEGRTYHAADKADAVGTFYKIVGRQIGHVEIGGPDIIKFDMGGGVRFNRKRRVHRNAGAEQNVITVPFRQGRKYSVAQVQNWVEKHGTPAMKQRLAQAMAQYRRFHKGSLPKFITYSLYKMGSHKGISDVEFGVSEGREWMAAYQVPRTSGKWMDAASGGRYVHAHGDSEIEVDIKRPVKLSKLPMRFHTPDGKAVGVIPSKNVKIGEWYEG